VCLFVVKVIGEPAQEGCKVGMIEEVEKRMAGVMVEGE
jgi:hypothetical protein